MSRVHCERLRFYADSDLNISVEVTDSELLARGRSGAVDHYTVEKLVAAREQHGVLEMEVLWLGFDASGSTCQWLPVEYLMTVVPPMVQSFVRRTRMRASALKTALSEVVA